MEFWSVIGVILVIIIFSKFVLKLGNTIPVLELMLLIAGLQWIIGPLIEYISPSFHYKYYMYVGEKEYMGYIVPAYLLFFLAILVPISKSSRISISIKSFSNNSSLGILLLVIGVFSDLFINFVPGSLKFFFYLISNFKYIGSIILFFSPKREHKIIFYVLLLYLFYNALESALFHEFILWSIFFYMFWAIKYKPSVKNILFTILLGIVFLVALQSFKATFRNQIWSGYSGNKVELFFVLLFDTLVTDGLFAEVLTVEDYSSEYDTGTNVRLNQGWIISSVMDNIPERQDYFGGSTISDAFLSSLFPRFLLPNKEVAGGQKNFERFTGLYLGDGTSMGISIIGEAYGNYGVVYGAIFMFFWGILLSFIWNRLFNFILNNLVYISFLPLIYLQVIKAETELVVVLNHLFKSLIVVFIFIYFYKRFISNR